MQLHTLANNVRLLVAGENTWLTNGNVYSQTIYLGNGDSPDNWQEVTQKVYDEYLKAQADLPPTL